MDLSGYTLATLHQDGEFVLCRGRAPANSPTDPPSVLVSILAAEHPLPAHVRTLQHELALRGELESTWALRPIALTQHQGHPALLFEDQQGEPLERLLDTRVTSPDPSDRRSAKTPMELGLFLRLAIGLAAALGEVHRRGIIHKDVKPTHILFNAATGQVWLTGFGIASRLTRERQTPAPPETIDGTLAYMAPEQTGHMNRSIDGRSDLYAVGVTLYQMLTGSLPFTASEPIEWVHCHIARQPMPPNERVENVPSPVSAIIMKLLSKSADGRYQTAASLERDLRHCLTQLEAQGRINDFVLGEGDTPDRLLIPEKLYGRAREIETLLAAFDRVVRGGTPELVLVSGYSGIGKSAAVNELHNVLVLPDGIFASGKFDQYQRDIPYFTLAQAFQSVVRSLLAKSDLELGHWRDALREALGPNGRLILDLVPALSLIIGEQPHLPELPPQDAQHRFHLTFGRFLSVFARPEHPLALFLDDLQWLDAATLDLIEHVLTQSDVHHLLLIGAYRDNEVTSAHPLTRTVDAIEKRGVPVHEIGLVPLGGEDVEQLIADSLRCDRKYAAPLAELVYQKTGGNPFFVIQFLTALVDEGLLSFDHSTAAWSWDLSRIRAKGYTDNVADLMVGKLRRLPKSTQDVLRRLACLGTGADFARLAMVYEDSDEKLRHALQDALRTELVLLSDNSYRFLHDRVQEAAYSLIPESQRAEAHLRIGRLLAKHTPPEGLKEAIFEIVNQLSHGAALLTSRHEKAQLAEFNLIAGKRAKASTAYVSALRYLAAGAALLSEDGWDRRPDLMFALDLHRAECEFLTGNHADAEARLSVLVSRAATAIDRAAVACLRIDLYTTLDRNDQAVDVCLAYLQHLGIDWSAHPTKEEAQQEYDRTWSLIAGREIEELVDLPLMSDPDSAATLDVLIKASTAALNTDANLHSLIICRLINLSLEYGNTDASCYGYVWLGTIAGPRFGNYRAGFRFAQLGYDLVEQHRLQRFRARTYLGFGVLIVPWTKHLRTARDLFRRAFDAANAVGDLTYAAFSWNNLITNLLVAGDPLPDVQGRAEQGLAFAERARFGLVIDVMTTQLALIRTLRGVTTVFGRFDDDRFDEVRVERRLADHEGALIAACWYWIRKLQARFLAGDFAAAIDASLHAQGLLWTSSSFLESADAHFYGALSHAASCDGASAAEYQHHLMALTAHHRQLAAWAENCPENFENRALLVGAEIARVERREIEAERLYEAAIQSARENDFVHNEALANELAARFYAARGFGTIADTYLRNARHGYLRWGAAGKVQQLDELHPYLKMEEAAGVSTDTIGAPLEQLDLATVTHVCQTVAGEIVFDKLIDTLMRTAIEHAGAERALLMLSRGVEQRIAAEARTDGDTVSVHLCDALVSASVLPETILRYVVHTGESVILDDVALVNPYSSDAYIRDRRARSVLCLPVSNQAKLIGVLYLENRLASGVFAPARVAVLKLLASQAAISLENTRLYRDLGERERESRLIVDTIPGLVATLTPAGEVEAVNEQVLAYCGRTLEELKQWATSDTVHPDDLPAATEIISSSLNSGSPYEIVERIRRFDGVYRWFQVRGLPLRGSNGTIVRWYVLLTDIEDLKRAEAALAALKDQLYNENLVLRDEVDRASMFEEIVGTSATLQPVLTRVTKVAKTDSTVLITGETGTGKELVARAIHRRSARASRAFVSVNCAAVPRELIASELFGHEKGAFTGATQRRLGRFELAHGGTIFLDEVGELPMETQVALLRVLQEREFERVGGSASVRIDVRVIAATNRDLQAAIEAGTFRSDLFYRLNVFPIAVPALRDRASDISLLVEYFIERYARKAGKTIRRINKRTLEHLRSYAWPGNVRELQNVIERSVIVCDTDEFTVDESWLSARPAIEGPLALSGTVAAHERALIEDALRACGGRVYGPRGAAARLGIPRSTLESRIRALRIVKSRFRLRPAKS
ncbi:MAG TPA: sigma 54-interacting transcriptional regulator [Vicinamibacterales bacterium]|nr:sigma 54-interacting transcriptional regulator [Vicinamibacterales bacterium]